MAQYETGHLERVAEMEKIIAAMPGFHIIGNSFHGIGVPHLTVSNQRGKPWNRLPPPFHSPRRFSFAFLSGRLRARRCAQVSLCFLRQFLQNKLIRTLNQLFHFWLAQSVRLYHCHPVVTRHVWRRNNPFDLHQFRKFFWSAFEGDFCRA